MLPGKLVPSPAAVVDIEEARERRRYMAKLKLKLASGEDWLHEEMAEINRRARRAQVRRDVMIGLVAGLAFGWVVARVIGMVGQ